MRVIKCPKFSLYWQLVQVLSLILRHCIEIINYILLKYLRHFKFFFNFVKKEGKTDIKRIFHTISCLITYLFTYALHLCNIMISFTFLMALSKVSKVDDDDDDDDDGVDGQHCQDDIPDS